MSDTVSLLAMPLIDPARERIQMTMPAGTRIADMVAEVLPGACEEHRQAVARVTIGGHEILPSAWRARPRAGQLVVIRILPQGGMRSILSVVVAISALVIAPYLGPIIAPAFGFAGGLAGGLANSLAAAGVMLAGNLLLNALIPQKNNPSTTQSPTYSLAGWRNVENPDGPVPAVLGQHRQAPPIIASTYTEVVGDDQYIRFLASFGIGPVDIQNLRIGETPIEQFEGLEYELRYGHADDAPITLYNAQVIEDQLSIDLSYEGGEYPQIRRTQSDITAFSIDLVCPQGLGYTNSKGDLGWWTIRFRVRYRQYGESAWAFDEEYPIVGKQTKILRRSLYFDVPARGRYEVEVTRTSSSVDDSRWIDDLVWSALRSHRPEAPMAFPFPLALIAIRIKASKQLNGTLDELTADVTRVCLDWDAPSQTWIQRATRNPASLFRWVAQGPGAAKPRTDAQMDLQGLQSWHEYCQAKGLCYDRVHDYEATEWDVLASVAAAGRASPRDDGRTIGVVVDRPQTQVVAAISPRNSWGFEWEQDYADFPDAFRISFQDRTDDYATKERIVPWPGLDGDPVRVETLDLIGVTDPGQIFLGGRRRQLELQYRPGRFRATQGLESVAAARGDLTILSHDIISRVQRAASVRDVAGTTVVIDEIVTMQAGVTYGARFVRPSTDVNNPMVSFVRSVATVEGEGNVLTLTGTGTSPAVGDDAFFGPLGQETFETVVSRVERDADFEATVHMVPHAPEIDAILDATVVPAWDGRAGAAVDPDLTPPAAPRVSAVSGQAAGGRGEDGKPLLRISLRPAAASAVLLASYSVSHRLAGGSWTSVTVAAGVASLIVSGYDRGAVVEIKATAASRAGVTGPDSDVISHEMAATDTIVPSPTALSADLPTSTIGGAAETVAVADAVVIGPDEALGAGYTVDLDGRAIFYVGGSGVLFGGPHEGGITVRWTNPNVAEFAAAHVWRAARSAGISAATDVSGSLYSAPSAGLEWTDIGVGAGRWDYWVTASTSAGDASDPAGPIHIDLI